MLQSVLLLKISSELDFFSNLGWYSVDTGVCVPVRICSRYAEFGSICAILSWTALHGLRQRCRCSDSRKISKASGLQQQSERSKDYSMNNLSNLRENDIVKSTLDNLSIDCGQQWVEILQNESKAIAWVMELTQTKFSRDSNRKTRGLSAWICW